MTQQVTHFHQIRPAGPFEKMDPSCHTLKWMLQKLHTIQHANLSFLVQGCTDFTNNRDRPSVFHYSVPQWS